MLFAAKLDKLKMTHFVFFAVFLKFKILNLFQSQPIRTLMTQSSVIQKVGLKCLDDSFSSMLHFQKNDVPDYKNPRSTDKNPKTFLSNSE